MPVVALPDPLKVLIHAPTPGALARARKNAANLLRARPDAEVRLVLNGEAVAAAVAGESDAGDVLTWLCPNTLASTGLAARDPMRALPAAAILMLATLQREGWLYVRA